MPEPVYSLCLCSSGTNRGDRWRNEQATNQPAVIEDNSYQGSADAETDTATDAAAQTVPATEQVTETVPAIAEVSTAEELKAAAAKGGEIKLLNDIAKGMAITGMGATLKNGTVSAKGSVLASDNGTVEIGFGSVASGVTLNNVNVRFYAPAEWTMFGQGVGLVYGTYNRDVSNYFEGSEKLEVVEQNGVYTVRDKVEAPAAIPAVTENAETPAAETEQTDVAAEEPVTETEQTNAAAEEPAAARPSRRTLRSKRPIRLTNRTMPRRHRLMSKSKAMTPTLKAKRPLLKAMRPLSKATTLLSKATKPLPKAKRPLSKAMTPLLKVTRPLLKATRPLLKVTTPLPKASRPTRMHFLNPMSSRPTRLRLTKSLPMRLR